VDNDNWFFPVFVEPQAFLRQKYEDATIAFALEERQLACFGRQPRSGDGHRELERQKQFSPDTMTTDEIIHQPTLIKVLRVKLGPKRGTYNIFSVMRRALEPLLQPKL
jgi:hypothetical protein